MLTKINEWLKVRFAKPEVGVLVFAVIIGIIIIVFFGQIFAPILAGIVLAFLLDSVVDFLIKIFRLPRGVAVAAAYIAFCALFIAAVILLLPGLWRQLFQLISHFPDMVGRFHALLLDLPNQYPRVFSEDFISDLVQSTSVSKIHLPEVGKFILTYSITSLPSIVTWIVYLVLVPLLTLYFLKDKVSIMNWLRDMLPERRRLLEEVGSEMKFQLGRYVQGKFLEVIIVWISAYVGFMIFGLNYSFLLGFCVGISAIIPYIGMVFVTIPVIFVGLLQWGLGEHFMYMFLVYLIIQGLDGSVLVPILFAGAVNLHPVAIIAAILFFGGIWGFWGLFFAIPLATLVRAIGSAWYRHYLE
jgi:putative permease